MIAVENLQLTIEGKEVLNGVNMHLQPGDIYGLLGPNGAGKSTTIFTLLGLRERQAGRVDVLGKDPKDNAVAIRRSLGVMPEKAGFYEWMAAFDYLKWYSTFYDFEPSTQDLVAMLEKVGLGGEEHRAIGSYSRGMKQRLAVARALIFRPQLLILDEPTNGLDPKGRREIHDLLLEFVSDGESGVLLCTHLLDDVDRLCNRIGIIENGCTRLEGSIAELLTNEANGKRYRLRLGATPNADNLPEGITLLGHEGDWWHIQTTRTSNEALSSLWTELWQRGWQILEIHSEASSLEEIYMKYTGQEGRQAHPEKEGEQ
jgi:ABC-2 type transport system ATP-binding protein